MMAWSLWEKGLRISTIYNIFLSSQKSKLIYSSLLSNFSNSGFKTTDAGLNSLRKGFQKLASLKKISLNLCKHDLISDTGLKSLRKGLQRLPSLQHFSLKWKVPEWLKSSKQITNDGLKSLTQGLQKITSLQSLSLDLGHVGYSSNNCKCWIEIFGARSSEKY